MAERLVHCVGYGAKVLLEGRECSRPCSTQKELCIIWNLVIQPNSGFTGLLTILMFCSSRKNLMEKSIMAY